MYTKLWSLLAISVSLTIPALAFDAGGFALQQHQHQLLQQQTAPNNVTGNTAGHPSTPRGVLQAIPAEQMQRLRAEYELRVRRDGQQAADGWLSQQAYRLGQEAARKMKEQ